MALNKKGVVSLAISSAVALTLLFIIFGAGFLTAILTNQTLLTLFVILIILFALRKILR